MGIIYNPKKINIFDIRITDINLALKKYNHYLFFEYNKSSAL